MATTSVPTSPPSLSRREPHAARRRAVALALGIVLLLGGGIAILSFVPRGGGPAMFDDAPLAAPADIDGKRAFGYLERICAIGPRPAGSEANTQQRRLVAEHFRKLGGAVREQPFSADDPETGRPVEMANLIASWFPDRTDRVVIAAHYDTRPFPDQETDPRLRRQPFLGANDGASGVALLMEIAHHLQGLKSSWGVDLVLFDGEELVYGNNGDYFLGSKEFARAYVADRRAGRMSRPYRAGIVLDMVGGKNLSIKREPFSYQLARRLQDDVWGVAARLGVRSFKRSFGREVMDDHLPLNDAGIPTIDIIDFDYPHWHKATDTPENCDAESLADVGKVVTAWLAKPIVRR